MKDITQKDLILSLIKDDLINTKLINGLNNLGLDATEYMLELSDTIFKLIGVKERSHKDSNLIDLYLGLTQKVSQIDIVDSRKPLDGLALKIYNELTKYKQGTLSNL